MKERYNKILELLTNENKIDVVTLSKKLNVSQVTIRKDLDYLEESGIVKRAHGYASLSTENDIIARLAYHFDIKQMIAKKASELVEENETIMIENGSCCALLALELAKTKKNITIITNSAFICDYIRKVANFEVILLGGNYQKDSQVNVGPLLKENVKNFWVDKFFIGIDGYHDKTGFTNKDQFRAQALKDMAKQAEKIIVLTESEKFSKRGNIPMNINEKVKLVITDYKIKSSSIEELKQKNINVIKV